MFKNINEKININNKMTKLKEQKGGFLNLFGDSKSTPGLNGIRSETRLVRSYENYITSKRDYEAKYDKHMDNLMTMDKFYGLNNSLVSLFKDSIYSKYIEKEQKINTNNALLLRNYLFAVTNQEPTPVNFRKDHIIAQINNVLYQYHSNDRKIFSDIDIKLEGNKVDITFILMNGERVGKKVSINSNYIVKEEQVDEAIKSILDKYKIPLTKVRKGYKETNNFIVKEEELNIPGFNNSIIENKDKLSTLLINNRTKKRGRNNNSNIGKKEYKPKNIDKKNSEVNNTLLRKVKGDAYDKEKEKVATGENKPLTKKQILDFQHQQVLPVAEEKNELGRDVFGIVNSTDELRKLLGLDENKNSKNKKTIYNDIPLEKLKQLDLSQIKDKDELDKICNRFSEDEETCKKTDACWYNPKSEPKCYRFKQKDEV